MNIQCMCFTKEEPTDWSVRDSRNKQISNSRHAQRNLKTDYSSKAHLFILSLNASIMQSTCRVYKPKRKTSLSSHYFNAVYRLKCVEHLVWRQKEEYEQDDLVP